MNNSCNQYFCAGCHDTYTLRHKRSIITANILWTTWYFNRIFTRNSIYSHFHKYFYWKLFLFFIQIHARLSTTLLYKIYKDLLGIGEPPFQNKKCKYDFGFSFLLYKCLYVCLWCTLLLTISTNYIRVRTIIYII